MWMRNSERRVVFYMALTCMVSLSFPMQESRGGNESTASPRPTSIEKPGAPPAPSALPVYVPPKGLGAPGARKGGAARGSTNELIVLSVLAPDHTALSARDQPNLYWFISKPSTAPVEFTLLDERSIYPRLEVRVGKAVEPGLQRVRLSDHGIRLEPGVKYEWTVAVVVDPARRSKDVLAGGVVEYMALPEEVATRLAREERQAAPGIYAWAGFWYDAVASISELIEAAPQDPWLRRQRAALMEQAHLSEVAAYDTGSLR